MRRSLERETRPLPTGTVTMLFTDMEGSTRLLQQLGDQYADVLRECRRLLRAAFEQCNGYEVDTQGDAFFVVFESALDAVSAAILAQRALFGAQWPQGVSVRVRMGIHTGEPQPADEGYIGLDVHRAARIMSVAHGGQVLLSQQTRDLVADELPSGVALWYLGEHQLKDIAGRTRLFQLTLPGLPDYFPLLSTMGPRRVPRPLPMPSTSFVGREQEVAAITQLLDQEEIRLLTLLGTAGVGKTRLALHVAAQLTERFAGNLAFVSLEQVEDAEAVLPAIVQALGMQETGATPLIEQVQALLNEQPFLLLLDNFEQVIPARRIVSRLLAGCPRLKILITSRNILYLQAEHLFEVLPLPLPFSEESPDQAARSPALALFLQRAQAVAPGFQLTPANVATVREICARLDGLPLAIELAAARLRYVSASSVLSQLTKNLGTLEATMQDIPERQRTLRSAIAWSYRLLEPDEQQVFRRLAVFANGATLEAARQVCKGDEVAEEEVAELAMRLVDKSMVQRRAREDQEERFWLLQTLSEYGKEQMFALGEWEKTRAQHAAYYLAWTEQVVPLLSGAQQVHWLDRLDQEYENVRSALAWTLQGGEEAPARAEQALRFCNALQGYWESRGHLKEGLTFLERALSAGCEAVGSLRAQAYYGAGFFALMLGENERAENFLRECQALFRASGERAGMANILRLQGTLAAAKNNYKIARRLLEEALAIYQERADVRKVVSTRETLAQIAMLQGDYERARALTSEDLAIYRATDETYAQAYPLYHLACAYFLSRENLKDARVLAEQSLAAFKAMGDRRFIAYVQALLGEIVFTEGKRAEEAYAQALLEESLAIFTSAEDHSGRVESLHALARLLVHREENERAQECYKTSWDLLHTLKAREQVAPCLEGAGQLFLARGLPEQAVRLWGTAAAVRAAIVVPLPPVYRPSYLQAVALARERLGEQAFREHWSLGSQTPWEQVSSLP